jgi:hypothetical protein
MRILSVPIAALLLTSFAVAQGTPDATRAWQQFLQQHGAAWTAHWNPATGTPTAIYGEGLTVKNGPITTLQEARGFAEATLDRHADLLGRRASTFVEVIGQKANRVWVFVYHQQFKGLAVVGGRADVRVHDIGGISMFGSSAFPIAADFDIAPAIDRHQARAVALRLHGLNGAADPLAAAKDRLVIFGDAQAATPYAPRLAWEVHVDRVTQKLVGRSYIDAKTGVELGFGNDYHECSFGCAHANHSAPVVAAAPELRAEVIAGPPLIGPAVNVVGTVMAWTNTGLRPTDPLVNVPVQNVSVAVQGGNSGFTDNTGSFNITHAGSTPVQVTVEFKGRYVGDTRATQGTKLVAPMSLTPGTPSTIQIYTPSAVEFDRAQSTAYWGTDDINQYLRSVIGSLPTRIDGVIINTSLTSTCNAHYTNNSINFYNFGGGCNMTAYSTVVYHEWGHGIDDAYGGISQTDGLSEGWGDIMAIYRTGQPIVGHDFTTSGGIVRTALNTLTYPAGGGVHQQGQTWMGFTWDVRENLRASKGSAAGILIAERIVLPSIVADAINQPNAVREVFIVDDDDNNLNNGTPNYLDLEKAALKRRLPYPIKSSTNPGAYSLFGQGCPGSRPSPAECMSDNKTLPLRGSTGSVGVTYALELVAATPLAVLGFQIKQASRTAGNVVVNTLLYDANAAGQPNNVLATGTMTVGSAEAFYSTTLNQQVNLAQGQKFFIAFVNSNPSITVGSMDPGTIVPYWRNNGTNGAWVQLQTRAWGYIIKCVSSGGAVPGLSNTGVPELTGSFDLNLSLAAANAPAVLLLGQSNSTWGAVSLPFSLAGLGAPGCSLLASGELMVVMIANTAGSASTKLSVPNDASLENAGFYNQVLVFDAQANALGLAVTRGGVARIGKP